MKKARSHRFKFFALSFGVSVVVLSLIFIPIMMEISPLKHYAPVSSAASSELPVYTPSAADNITALVIVTEKNIGRYFLLLRLNPVKGQIPVTSLPYNMLIKTKDKTETLQAIDSYGGTLQVKSILESALKIKIDRTARLTSERFIKSLNTVGTVKYSLPYSLIYKDVPSNTYINIPKGKQNLDGRGIYDLFRFPNYTEGEEHRYKVQCDVLAKLINERLNIWLIDHGESVFKTIINLLESDISYNDYTKEQAAMRYFATKVKEPSIPVFPSGTFDTKGFSLTQQSADTLWMYYADDTSSVSSAPASSLPSSLPTNS